MSLIRRAAVPLLLLAGACGGEEPPEASPARPRPLLVLGIDGATWDLIDPMIERGELPNLERLVERGARADLVSLPPLSSPPLWTTMATGRFPRHHNVHDHFYPYVPGAKRRVQSNERRVPALWNIASEAGRSVAVVGFYATHPPELVNGVMVSDQAPQGAPGSIYPDDVAVELQAEHDRLRDADEIRRLHRRYLPWPYDVAAGDRPQDPYHRVTRVVKGRIGKQLIREEFLRRAALDLAPRQLDLLMVYLRMPDHASHSTWLYFDESVFEEKPDPFDRELLKDVIPTAYRDSDAYLGQLLERLGKEINVVVLSDHGFGPAVGKWQRRQRREWRMLSGSHRPDGIFLAAGPDVRRGEVDGVSVMDVAPTLLALLGLPVSRELPGRVVSEILRPAFLSDFPIRESAAYRTRWQRVVDAEAPPAGAAAEDLEILAALGYVDAETPLASGDGGADLDFWSIEDRLRWSVMAGEVLFYFHRDDLAAIADVMALVEENDPVLRRRLPRAVKVYYRLWRDGFDFPVVSDATWRRFEASYDTEVRS